MLDSCPLNTAPTTLVPLALRMHQPCPEIASVTNGGLCHVSVTRFCLIVLALSLGTKYVLSPRLQQTPHRLHQTLQAGICKQHCLPLTCPAENMPHSHRSHQLACSCRPAPFNRIVRPHQPFTVKPVSRPKPARPDWHSAIRSDAYRTSIHASNTPSACWHACTVATILLATPCACPGPTGALPLPL